jgi:hypothetical protein
MCNSFTLKISKKKAYVSAFFYANFLSITSALSNIIIAQKMVDENLAIIIVTKFTTIAGEILIVLFLARTLKKVWYQTYWLTIVMHIILIIPMAYYMKVFTFVDSEERIIYWIVNRNNLPQYLLSVGIMLLSYMIVGYLVKIIIKRIDLNNISKKVWIGIYTVWASIILLTLKTYQYTADDASDKIVGFDNYREVIIALLVIIFCVAIAIIYSDQRVLKIQNALLKEQNELQYANYIAMQQMDLEIRKLYHDIGNHINIVQILIEQDDAQEAREYTRKLTEEYKNIKRELYCSNKIINAVLIQKLRTCNECGIRYELEISLPQPLPIKDIDLMCIYSNLLDNAIESCRRNLDTDNYIKIKTTQIGNYLGIKIINSKSAEQKLLTDEIHYITTKKDNQLHGYGLRIIEEIVKQYDGYKELQDNATDFSAMVMLKLMTDAETS